MEINFPAKPELKINNLSRQNMRPPRIKWLSVSDSEGGGGGRDVRPPPHQKRNRQKKKKKCHSLISRPFPHIWWLKMQNFLGSLRSPALFNIILNIALLKN